MSSTPTRPEALPVVVVGATGAHGHRIATELIRSGAPALTLVSRDEARLARLATVLGGPARGVMHSALDAATDPLAPALEGAGVAISCVDAHHVEVARAAIRAGVPCAVLAEDRPTFTRLRDLDADARGAGVTIVAGCGFDPGVTNLLIALAWERFDEVAEIELTVARSVRDTESPTSLTQLLAIFSDPSLPTRLPRLVYLPEPLGWVETFTAIHPDPPLVEATFDHRVGLTERVANDIARSLVAAHVPGRERLWAGVARPLGRLGAPAVAWTGARVDVHGRARGAPASITYGVVDHLDNLVPLVASLTAGALARRNGSGGVHRVEDVLDPKAALGLLGKRGVRLARLEAEPV